MDDLVQDNLLEEITKLLPAQVLAQMMVDRCYEGTDKWKYTEWIASKIAEQTKKESVVELILNGTKEIHVSEWNSRIDEEEKDKVNKPTWDSLVGGMSMLTPVERDVMINLKAPVVEYITKEINKLGGVAIKQIEVD